MKLLLSQVSLIGNEVHDFVLEKKTEKCKHRGLTHYKLTVSAANRRLCLFIQEWIIGFLILRKRNDKIAPI